jgi:hypothetical protein
MEKATIRTLCLGLLLLSTTAFSQNGNNINGTIRYQDNFNFNWYGVTAYLHNSNGVIISTTNVNNGGHYMFHDVAAGTYNITFSTEQPAGGVTLTDAFLVMQNILQLYTFNPMQALAANVDGDEDIDWDDYDLILVGYLNEGEEFPVGPWIFEPCQVIVPAASREGFTTRGGSSGDVNGSLIPDPKSSSIFLDNPSICMTARSSDPIEFKLSSTGDFNVTGMHLIIDIPEGLQVFNVESSIPEANVTIQNNQVRVTWIDSKRKGFEIVNGRPLLVVTTKVTSPSREGNNYSLRLNDESHFIDASGEIVYGVALTLPTIRIINIEEFSVAVYPNPFRENTNLNCDLPENGSILISLFDQAGRQVREISDGNCSAGNYQARIDGPDLMPGIYHYTIVYSGNEQLINSGTIIKSK